MALTAKRCRRLPNIFSFQIKGYFGHMANRILTAEDG